MPTPVGLVPSRVMTDSELAVESRVKNPFTIDRFSGGKLLFAESFSQKGGVNSHVKARFQATRTYTLDSQCLSIRPKLQQVTSKYDSATGALLG